VPNPLGPQGAEAAFKLLETILAPGVGLLMILSAASMVARFRRAQGAERQQLKWFTFAAALSALLFLTFVLTGLDTRGPSVLTYVIAALWLMGIPVAIGVALLRYHLFDIDRLINRTLVYGLLTAILGLGYAGAVLILGQISETVAKQPPSWAVAGATLAIAALFQPARRRIQAAVDRRFNRRRYDAAKTIEAFSARSAMRLTWTLSPPSSWRWSLRPWNPPRRRCGCDRRWSTPQPADYLPASNLCGNGLVAEVCLFRLTIATRSRPFRVGCDAGPSSGRDRPGPSWCPGPHRVVLLGGSRHATSPRHRRRHVRRRHRRHRLRGPLHRRQPVRRAGGRRTRAAGAQPRTHADPGPGPQAARRPRGSAGRRPSRRLHPSGRRRP
jgi:hypothetical protein